MSIIPTLDRLKESLKTAPKIIIDGTLMTFDCEGLDEFYTEKAAQELRETPDVTEEALKIFMDLLAEEKDLFIPKDKEFLQMFLRRCKWYPDSAFRLIKRYYDYKRKHPEFYNDFIPNKYRSLFLSGVFLPLPRRTAAGERIGIIQSGLWKPKENPVNEVFRGILMYMEVAALEVKTQVTGFHMIIDVGSLKLKHVAHFTPSFAKSVVDFVANCLPVRLKGIHIVNNPFFFLMIFAFFKPFLNAKLKARIFMHGDDRASLLKHIDANALPKHLGGELDFPAKPMDEPYYTYVCTYDDFFKDNNRYGYVTKT